MPFNFLRSKDPGDYKARLERKMCMARDTPEPIFDLSECHLKTVPCGTFSLCRVLRKEALFLQDNLLTSFLDVSGSMQDIILLKVLDIHSNKITKFPEDMGLLVNLEILNASDNKLTAIPESLGRLTALRSLMLSNNKLKSMPETITNCKQLHNLDLRGNPHIMLPSTLSTMVNLETLHLDDRTGAPVRLLNKDSSTSIIHEERTTDNGIELAEESSGQSKARAVECQYFILQEKLKLLEENKEQQKQRRLEWEKTLLSENDHDLLNAEIRDKRSQLVSDIKSIESKLGEELSRVQEQKDLERHHLIQQCLKSEEEVNKSVQCLLENTRRAQEQMAHISMVEDQLLPKLHSNCLQEAKQLDSAKVINAMNDLVNDELIKAEKIRKYETQRRIQATNNWISDETEMTTKLSDWAAHHKSRSQELRKAIQLDEDLQKAAVAAMMVNSDAKSWQLAQQISSLENQLAEVTKIELKKRKLEQEEHITDLACSRVALTALLMDMLAQQQSRRDELLTALQSMEMNRGADQNEYWLLQYQQLLNSASHQLVQSMQAVDTRLQQELATHGLLHYLPLICHLLASQADIAAISDARLQQAGINDADIRLVLIKVFKSYLEEDEGVVVAPSAPVQTPSEPTCPPLSPADVTPRLEAECVVCMAADVEALFLPCGHMCCCAACASLAKCPLCRTKVETVMQARFRR